MLKSTLNPSFVLIWSPVDFLETLLENEFFMLVETINNPFIIPKFDNNENSNNTW